MTARWWCSTTNSEAALSQVAGITPLGRLGQPDDIADIVALLASHEGRWLTGQIIHATGGLATGGMITHDLVAQMRCRYVLGPANNQLDEPEPAEELHAHGITWAPDTVVSAGGVIHAVAIERERATAQQARQRVIAIGDTLTAILTEARSRGVSPARAARERRYRPGTGTATRPRCSRGLVPRTRLNAVLSANGVL